MRRSLYLLLVPFTFACFAGCVQTGISADDVKSVYPDMTEKQLEEKLKKEGKWEEYQEMKKRDAEYERAGSTGSTSQ